ncbi:MAG TPA: alpha-ketoacid dehydrogenase subunit beta, partial [bacterium]|nr:alpha-ketoacid dehydrogenase subunit beta [bacterium]
MARRMYVEAIIDAQREEMRRDPNVFILGEDIGIYGGVFKATAGLKDEFGFWRVLDTPIAEELIIGAAVGASLVGMRPIAEIQFCDFIASCHDMLTNQCAKLYFRSGGTWAVPMVVRVPFGGGVGGGIYHSQSNEAWYLHTPGLKVVCPATPYDAKGLLKAAVRDNNPVIYFEHKRLYREAVEGNKVRMFRGREHLAEIPDDDYVVEIGKAGIAQEGTDVTIVAYSLMLFRALDAAKELEREGVSAEVIDLKTLLPLDRETIINSVMKTGRLIMVHESPMTGGVGAEIVSTVTEAAFDYLDARPVRICGSDTPFPFHPKMEADYMPQTSEIVEAALAL